jgi:hypothetical protein
LNGTSTEYTCTKKPVFVPLGKVVTIKSS